MIPPCQGDFLAVTPITWYGELAPDSDTIGIKKYNLEFEHNANEDLLVLKNSIPSDMVNSKEDMDNNYYAQNNIINTLSDLINKTVKSDREKIETTGKILEIVKKDTLNFMTIINFMIFIPSKNIYI